MPISIKANDFGLIDIESEICKRFRYLRFSQKIERQFELDNVQPRCQILIRNNYIALFIYHCFLYSDFRSVGDAFALDLSMHFLVMSPIVFLTHAVPRRHPPEWLREGLESASLVVLTLTIVTVVAVSRLPDREIVQFTVALVVLFAIVMQRISFWYVLPLCFIIQIIYTLSLAMFMNISADRAIISNFLFSGIVLFSLVGAYNLEHDRRMSYLLQLRDRFRNRLLEIESLQDPLTGLGNRRALQASLARLGIDGTPSVARSVGFMLVEIDHFKLFNDTNGHQEGDVCLKRVAALIDGALREGQGHAYRFGGEEFLVLLDDTTLGETGIVAERIRRNVETAAIPCDASSGAVVTISAGVAFGSTRDGVTPDTLIAAADAALYAAKARGRSQVSLSAETLAESRVERRAG